jgi:hypothetical protein
VNLEQALALPEFLALDDQQVMDYGSGLGNPIIITQLQTVAAIVELLGEDVARTIVGTIKSVAAQDPLTDAFYIKLSSFGEDWSNAKWQVNIDKLAAIGGWPPEIVAKLKAMGIKPRTRWEELEVIPPTSLDEIATARQAGIDRAKITSFMSNTLNARISIGLSVEEFKQFVADWTP